MADPDSAADLAFCSQLVKKYRSERLRDSAWALVVICHGTGIVRHRQLAHRQARPITLIAIVVTPAIVT